ncbi:hypothetical protein ACFL3R_00610 [Thermodesulfobacteriota bacterium]
MPSFPVHNYGMDNASKYMMPAMMKRWGDKTDKEDLAQRTKEAREAAALSALHEKGLAGDTLTPEQRAEGGMASADYGGAREGKMEKYFDKEGAAAMHKMNRHKAGLNKIDLETKMFNKNLAKINLLFSYSGNIIKTLKDESLSTDTKQNILDTLQTSMESMGFNPKLLITDDAIEMKDKLEKSIIDKSVTQVSAFTKQIEGLSSFADTPTMGSVDQLAVTAGHKNTVLALETAKKRAGKAGEGILALKIDLVNNQYNKFMAMVEKKTNLSPAVVEATAEAANVPVYDKATGEKIRDMPLSIAKKYIEKDPTKTIEKPIVSKTIALMSVPELLETTRQWYKDLDAAKRGGGDTFELFEAMAISGVIDKTDEVVDRFKSMANPERIKFLEDGISRFVKETTKKRKAQGASDKAVSEPDQAEVDMMLQRAIKTAGPNASQAKVQKVFNRLMSTRSKYGEIPFSKR